MGRFNIFKELHLYLRVGKRWWMGPLILILAVLGMLLFFVQGSSLAPFIYALF